MNWKVDKNVPIRDRGKYSGFLNSLRPGDSFLCTRKEARAFIVVSRRIGKRLVTRTEDAKGPRPVRIWMSGNVKNAVVPYKTSKQPTAEITQ